MQVIRRCLAIVLLAGFFSSAGLADALPRSLLILNEGSAGIQGYADTAAALRATINAGASEPFAFYIEDLDLNLFQGLKYQKALLTYLREKYSDRRIGIIVANGTEALKLALQLRSDPRWGEIPIVFATVDERRVRSLMPLPNVTGRFLEFSLGASVDAARVPRSFCRRTARIKQKSRSDEPVRIAFGRGEATCGGAAGNFGNPLHDHDDRWRRPPIPSERSVKDHR